MNTLKEASQKVFTLQKIGPRLTLTLSHLLHLDNVYQPLARRWNRSFSAFSFSSKPSRSTTRVSLNHYLPERNTIYVTLIVMPNTYNQAVELRIRSYHQAIAYEIVAYHRHQTLDVACTTSLCWLGFLMENEMNFVLLCLAIILEIIVTQVYNTHKM